MVFIAPIPKKATIVLIMEAIKASQLLLIGVTKGKGRGWPINSGTQGFKGSFHPYSYWKATMKYHKTKDILYVMQLLGYKNIENTLIYTQLVGFKGEDEFICKVAKTVDQALELIEAGFEYVCEIEGVKLFRKRK